MSRRSLETSTPAKSRAVVFVVVGSKSFLLCHSRPVLADTGSPRLRTKGYRQLFGLSLLVLNGKGATTWRLLRGLDGPGPRSVCRAHPADFMTANKIQGPRLLRPLLRNSTLASFLTPRHEHTASRRTHGLRASCLDIRVRSIYR